MQKTLQTINKEIQQAIGIPHLLANIQVECAGYYANYSEQFAMYEVKRAKYIKALHEEGKSIAYSEQAWLTEDDGERWNYLRYYLKSLKLITKSIESATYVANAEYKIKEL